IAGISIVCAGAGNGDTAVTAKEDVQPKVGASIESSSIYIADYFPEFEKIKIDPAYKYLELEPGDSDNFTVTVENRDNKTIELKPDLIITPYTENFMDENWTIISPSEKTLKPGEKQEFQVKVSIPEDSYLGNYAALIRSEERRVGKESGSGRTMVAQQRK